jgi:transposase-like protein
MPQPSRKTSQRIERMLAMHAKGASARELADELGVNHGTILAWLRDAGLEPNGGQGARKKRKRTLPDEAAQKLVEKQRRLAELEIPEPTRDLASALAAAHAYYVEQLEWCRAFREDVRNGTKTMTDLSSAQLMAERFLTKIRELTPQDDVDPAKDTGNLGAARETREKLLGLVEAQERIFVCASCGGNPYRKGR